LVVRASMVNPFDIISYLAGLTRMDIKSFGLAMTIATLPEALLFTFAGSKLRSLRLSLQYLGIIIVVFGILGVLLSFLMIQFVRNDLNKKRVKA
jgi:uncharacterized membrane protein YdjX (TVP38/TMEM64 family)